MNGPIPPPIELLGLRVHPVDRKGLMEAVAALIARSRRGTIAYVNVHVMNLAASDRALRDFLNGVDLCYCDGEGVRLGARLLQKELPMRMTGADWIWELAARAEEEGWRIFWMGGEPGVAVAAAERLRQRHPGLQIAADHGFYPVEAQEALLSRIRAFAPQILLVGMGSPTQERWVATWRERLDIPVVWVLGATADFVSGRVSRGPAWLHQRQEWLARLLTEPGRLWKRYLIGNSRFFLQVLVERLRTGGEKAG